MTKRDVFSSSELTFLRKRFGALQTIHPDQLPEFHRIFSCSGDRALRQLAGANIRFLSALAANACVRRGIVETDAERAEAGLSREAVDFKRALLEGGPAAALRAAGSRVAMTRGQQSLLEPVPFVRTLTDN
jgi:hypothetical protein